MRRAVIVAALAAALVGMCSLPVAAQQNGLVIQNNGVDSADSAAGADNVRISRAPGNSASNDGAGSGNEERRVVRGEKERDRGGRGGRGNGEAAPAEAAPVDTGYQEYADPSAAPQETAGSTGDAMAPIKLPNTGSGAAINAAWLALAAAVAAAGAAGLRRQMTD